MEYQHCMSAEQKVSDLLLMLLYYQGAAFHIVDEAGCYLGSLNQELLAELDWELLIENPSLGEICRILRAIPPKELGNRSVDISMKENTAAEELCERFMNTSSLLEIPLVDLDGRLKRVAEKYTYLAKHAVFAPLEDGPAVISFTTRKMPADNLNRYARNVNSQHGEDGILEAIFELIGTTNKAAIEFGGWDGVFLSNIRNLIVQHGFSGLYIEGDPEKAAAGRKNYEGWDQVRFVEGYVGFRDNKSLDAYLHEAGFPQSPDLLCIDIDGYDYHVWKHLTDFTPRVVLIEFNPTIANEILFIPPEREDRFMGSSALAMVMLGISKGYSLAAVTHTNCIFVLDSEFPKLGIVDNSLNALRPRETYSVNYWLQSYDEHIYHTGDQIFYWSGRPFSSNQFYDTDKRD